jgi:toxin FitB
MTSPNRDYWLIAATARVNGLTVVTRNVKDFERSGVEALSPFGD